MARTNNGLCICLWFDAEAEDAAKFYTGVSLCMQPSKQFTLACGRFVGAMQPGQASFCLRPICCAALMMRGVACSRPSCL
jgi:predicted 3-demethylubiquinone-9 3-methyltransferase (glyoxalase superfamily)